MRRRVLVALVIGLLLLLTGCWDRIEVEDQLFPVTIAVDKGERNRYRITMRVPLSARMQAGVLGGQGGPGSPATILIAEGDTIQQAIYTLNVATARRINIRHMRGVVMGEELARDGLDELLTELHRNAELRSTAAVFVALGDAGEALRLSKPTGETNPGKINEGILLVEKQLHMAPPTRIHHLINRTGLVGVDPIAPLVAVNRQVLGEETLRQRDSGIAGKMDRMGENPVDTAGTALLQGRRLVGFLTVDETQALLALRGEMGKAYITIPNPFEPETNLTLRFQQENLPQYRAWFAATGPRVSIRILFEGEVLSGSEDYRSEGVRRRVEEAAADYMRELMRGVLDTTRELEVDPVGFGLLFRGRFPTWEAWQRYDWRSQVGKLQVNVTVDMRLRRFGLILGSDLSGEAKRR